ncbi:metal dependent phosphohydrolase [Desulfovibrio sp. X2]|nr:metal dependent phosphohydrolase [Desulfovibrio sp. X2]
MLLELYEVAEDPRSSATDMAAVVSRDPGLAALLLRMVNSAFYGFPRRIDTVPRAVAVIGQRQLAMLATGGVVARIFGETPAETIRLETFWRHSVGVGILARTLARRLRLNDPERHFVAGLLHDIGRLALCSVAPERVRAALAESRRRAIPLRQAESQAAGIDHAAFGSMLLRKWNLPFSLALAVLRHHDPTREDAREEAAVVHVADWLMKALHPALEDEFLLPPLAEGAWERVGLPLSDLPSIAEDVDASLAATLSALRSGAA